MTRIYYDGEARPSSHGDKRVCLVAIHDGEVEVLDLPSGRGSAYDAEWDAVIMAAAHAVRRGWPSVTLLGDHEGIVDTVMGRTHLKRAAAKAAMQRFEEAAQGLDAFCAEHVPRHLNLAGRCLESGRASASFLAGLSMLEGVEIP